MSDSTIEVYEAALKLIAGVGSDEGPFGDTYRAVGGGYDGLQAVALMALAHGPREIDLR